MCTPCDCCISFAHASTERQSQSDWPAAPYLLPAHRSVSSAAVCKARPWQRAPAVLAGEQMSAATNWSVWACKLGTSARLLAASSITAAQGSGVACAAAGAGGRQRQRWQDARKGTNSCVGRLHSPIVASHTPAHSSIVARHIVTAANHIAPSFATPERESPVLERLRRPSAN